jgi:uncharacterized Zn-finger protein
MSDVKEFEVTAKDLPLHCPTKEVALWASHPRVYMDMTEGTAQCPYCGTVYKLKAGEHVKSH